MRRSMTPAPRCLSGSSALLVAALSMLSACSSSSGGGEAATPDAGGSASGGTVGTGGATGAVSGTGGATFTGSGGAPVTAGSGGDVGTGGGPSQSGGTSGRGNGGTPGSAAGGGATGQGTAGRGGTSGGGGRPGGTGGATSVGGATGKLTIWLAGDSTMANGGPACPIGWGSQFKPLFNDLVTVNNSARAGTSLRTWLYNVLATTDATGECNLTLDAMGQPVVNQQWQNMLTNMKAGDYLFIEFGINDGGACPRFEGDAAFKTSYGMMAQAAKDRGAHPVFLTPVSSIACMGNVAIGTRGRFVTDAKDAGTQFDVPVIDVHALSVAHYTASGFCPAGAAGVTAATGGPLGAFFCNDHTHFETAGALSIAQLVAEGIRTANLPLAAYLN